MEHIKTRIARMKWFNQSIPIDSAQKKRKKTIDSALQPSESEIQKAILQYLGTVKNIMFWRNNTGVMQTQSSAFERGRYVAFGAKGSPDIFVIRNGQFIGLEVKTAKGKQSESQKSFQQKLESVGGQYYLVRSVDETIKIFK